MTDVTAGVALVGMPDTGKSTYLTALYHLLSERLTGTPARLVRQPEQRAYLDGLRATWLAGEQLGRTSQDNGELVELHVGFDDQEVLLAVPDVAGESFRDVVVARHADGRIVELIRDAAGLLLFTHPDQVRPRVLIAEAKQIADALGETMAPAAPKEFDPLRVPGEVHLIDLLQWAARSRSGPTPTRLAIMVSAWDRCGDSSPAAWLAKWMPMLQQFLDGHAEDFTATIYGVCAQGGAYGEAVDLAAKRPYDRAYVVDAAGTRSGDLSGPLRWAALG